LLSDPETLEVEVEVLLTQAVKIAPGSRVLVARYALSSRPGSPRSRRWASRSSECA
jgi:hypothetical protein